MWTNVFRIGGLHQISWFQFLPQESDLNPHQDRSSREGQKDASMLSVLSAHLQLQKQGFLSAWTNSFVGPWDPSQGVYNPDEKIKLWLFLPGRRSSVVETAQPAVSKLRVVNSGLWLAPGDSEDVASAISQALRNCMERALIGGSYMRFGDVFSRIHPFSQGEELFRRRQPTIEFIFAATEEAILVHVIVSAKHIRPLSSGDMERVLKCSSDSSNERLSVIVSPHGIRGKLTGVCPSDLVKQVYFRSGRLKTSNRSAGLPYNVSLGSTGQIRGQNCYVEVTVGLPRNVMDKPLQSESNHVRNLPKHHAVDASGFDRNSQKGSLDNSLVCERTFIYPAEAVIVPILQTSLVRSSLKRFWLQNWIGPSLTGSSVSMHWSYGGMDLTDGHWNEQDKIAEQHSYDSSSNSNDSSISSISGNSSDSDYKMTKRTGDLEADADSLTCRQSGLSSKDQGTKRPRAEILESYGQPGTVGFKSDYGSASAGVGSDPLGSQWVWDEDDNGICIDMQTLVSEFGDFGDLFENDFLPFGEPPGTAESQALMFSAPDSGEMGASPSVLDVSDQMLVSVGFPSFETFNPPSTAAMEECLSKNEELQSNTISGPISCTPCFTGELDHLMKNEALMTFPSEYGAIETPACEFSSSIFKSPYFPKSKQVESSNSSTQSYVYGATPPSPSIDVSLEKPGMPVTSRSSHGKHNEITSAQPKNFYAHVDSGIEQHNRKVITSSNSITSCEGGGSSVFNSTNPVSSVQKRIIEGEHEENPHLSLKTVLAIEVDCVMFQAFMCRMRHTLPYSTSLPPIDLSKLTRTPGFSQLIVDPSTMTDNVSGKYEIKKKESVPVRIAGDMDGGVLDGPLHAPVGVWRSVGGPRGGKSSNVEVCKSLPNNSFNEDGMLSYSKRQPLQELLDGMALLVQQATSFVDVALDSDCGDGPYGWLALQEQCRRGFSCGPYMVHAGCGGSLASCHSLDTAGMELIDPLSVEVHASSVINLLQSDIKTALKSAFGNIDGPLSVTDWCKGCGQLGDTGIAGDVFAADSTVTGGKDSMGTAILSVGESITQSQTFTAGLSSLKDGSRMNETRRSQESSNSESEQLASRPRPSHFQVPLPSILVGYQDDWLKTSASSLQLWEKAPFEPYAQQKHMTYYVICPDIDPLASAATDFFQQLGTFSQIYSTCNLGNHSPERLSNQMDIDSGKSSSSGFLLLDCPQSMKMESSNASIVGSISDYFLSLSNGWDLTSYLTSLSKVLRTLKFGSSSLTVNSKDGSSGLCTVIYIVCPFSDPAAILQTIIESSVTVGSIIFSSEKDRRSIVQSQVGKALNCATVVDEASSSSILTLSGFIIPKLVVQIVTVDAIFRVTSPPLNEQVILKEIAFAVYNKARRITRGSSCDAVQSSSVPSRSHPVLMQMTSPMSGMWKDCVGQNRMGGASLPREGELDASLRPGAWDSSWQTTRDSPLQDDNRYMFEPLFILAEPGSLEHGVPPSVFGSSMSDSSKPYSEENNTGFMQSASSVGIGETGVNSQLDGPESESSSYSKGPPSLHCCYGWTEDWRWLVSIWTDSRGELLDSHIFPFGGISSRHDTKGLQFLFVQVLQQGCQILQACCPDIGAAKPRDFVITRIGYFYELECQEWQKAIYSIGGSDVKKWPLHLRRSVPDGMSSRSNGSLSQQQEMSLIQERALPSASPVYSHSKSSGFAKGSFGQPAARKQLVGGSLVDSSRGILQWVQSISLVTISIDHSLYLISQADSTSPGGAQVSTSTTGQSSYVEGFSPVKSLDSTSGSCIIIPSPSMRFLSPAPLQLPSCLTAESPPLAHLLHSKGSAVPFSTAFVVSKAVPSMRRDSKSNSKEEWPSVLSVGLVDYYGGTNTSQEKNGKGTKQGGRNLHSEVHDFDIETHLILESVAAELHALSWMTVSPAYLDRRTALPSHCDMVLRLRRLLHYADKELFRQPEKS